MDKTAILSLLEELAEGGVSVDSVYKNLRDLPFQNIDFARLDTHRSLRQGQPEVIYCPGKTADQVIAIAKTLKAKHEVILGTKAEPDLAQVVRASIPETNYYPQGKILLWGEMPAKPKLDFKVSVITAGTADLPIAEEAALYLQASGIKVEQITDVGVAGLHRLLAVLPSLQESSVCIVVAGMDGALPSVIAGLLSQPVIAVPTSIGYGAAFSGIAPLLTMLNSCAAGLTVVNIDNGFGAAAAAMRILLSLQK